MEAENIVDKKELKGLPIWACILLFIVVFFVFMLLYSALIQGFLSLVLGVETRHPGIVGYILQETGMLLAALTLLLSCFVLNGVRSQTWACLSKDMREDCGTDC